MMPVLDDNKEMSSDPGKRVAKDSCHSQRDQRHGSIHGKEKEKEEEVFPRSSTPIEHDAASLESPTTPDWQEYKRTLQHKKQLLLQVREYKRTSHQKKQLIIFISMTRTVSSLTS